MQPLEAPPPLPTVELPRLRVIHLMMWMAATAVALLPQLMLQQRLRGASPNMPAQALPVIASIRAVAAGGCILVVGIVLNARRRGSSGRLQPGHWLAIDGTLRWMFFTAHAAMVTWIASDETKRQWLSKLHMFWGGLVFLGHMWLALRADQSLRWRLAFGAMALWPVASLLVIPTASYSGVFENLRVLFLFEAAVPGAQSLLLLPAIVIDATTRADRHWTHWLGAGLRAASLVATSATYGYYAFNPDAFTSR